jgi:UDP:flavonoid glycosyltransferase YjiC (YdhE family)
MATDGGTGALRVLCVTQPGDGHLNPIAPVADGLVAAGHEVLFATSRPYIPDVERRGFDAVAVGPDFRWDAALARWPEGANNMGAASAPFWVGVVERDISPAFTSDVLDLVTSFKPDLLLAEYATIMTMTTVRELTGLPLAMTAWATEPGSHGFLDSGLRESLNRFRQEYGLVPVGDLPALEHWIVFTPPSWGRVQGEPLVSTVRVRQSSVRTSNWSAPDHTGPFVYGTLGTVYNTRRRLRSFVDALGLGGWSGLVTVGNTLDPADFAAPPQISVQRFVPQADVLEHADVMLCHGGLGSVLGAIESGTPMVIVPLGADQLVNAEIARELGIATVVDPDRAGPEALCEAISTVLASSSHRAASASLRDEAMAMIEMKDAVRQLVTTVRP